MFASPLYLIPIIIKFWIIIITFLLNVQKAKLTSSTADIDQQVKKFKIRKGILLVVVPLIFSICVVVMLTVATAIELILYLIAVAYSVIYGLASAAFFTLVFAFIIFIQILVVVIMKIKAPFAMFSLNMASIALMCVIVFWITIGAIFYMEELYAYIEYVFLYVCCYSTCIIELLLAVGIPIMQAIIWKKQQHQNKFQTQIAENEISQLLHDEQGFKLFSDFAASEWSSENLRFYTDFNYLKQRTAKEEQIHLMKEKYYELYIVHDGALCLNIDAPTSNKVKEVVKKWKDVVQVENLEKQFEELMNAYELVSKQIFICMTDTFSRLKTTPKFKKWFEHFQSSNATLNELGWKT